MKAFGIAQAERVQGEQAALAHVGTRRSRREFLTLDNKSRTKSREETQAMAPKAKPTTYGFRCSSSFLNELVARNKTREVGIKMRTPAKVLKRFSLNSVELFASITRKDV